MADIDPGVITLARPRPRFTADEFERMIGTGAFDDLLGGVELVRGEIVRMNSKYLPHVGNQSELFLVLAQLLRFDHTLRVFVEPSIRLSDDTVREPDIAVFERQPRGVNLVPAGAVRLAIEVADSTLGRDLGIKLEDYARAGVPRVWVVDVQGEVVHLCAEPGREGYAARRVIRFGEPIALAPLADAELVIPVGGFD